MLLDIVILPPAKLRQKLGRAIVKATEAYPTIFQVDNNHLIPHVSLLHLRTSKLNIFKLSKHLRQILLGCRPFFISSHNIEIEFGKIIGLRLQSSKTLQNLHELVAENCHIFKSGPMPPYPLQDKKKLTKQRSLTKRKYGVSYVGKYYRPHFTMGALNEGKYTSKAAKKLQNLKIKFEAHQIAICEVNKYWQVTKILKRFRIK